MSLDVFLEAINEYNLKATIVFLLFFTTIFFTSKRLWKRARLKEEDRALLASCTVSLSHGVPAAVVAAWQLAQAWPIDVDSQNSPSNHLLLQYTLAYMIADTLYYLVPYTPTDFLFCTHHGVVIIYVLTAILHGRGGISCIFMLLFGECTSLWQNSWYVCTTLRGRKQWLDTYRGFLTHMYPASYILARSILGPPSVLWLCYKLHEAKTLFTPFRDTWLAICLISLAGSQLWSFSLAKTWLQGEKEPLKLAEKLN